MSEYVELARHYQRLILCGELKPEDVPSQKQMMADWEVSNWIASEARKLLMEAGLAVSVRTPTSPIGPISDMDWAFRFLPKVLPRDLNGCLLWNATANDSGYGKFKLNGRMVRAHRVAWEYHKGPIPDGYEVDHVDARGCRSRLCVNVEHLDTVTRAENQRRRRVAARRRALIQVRTELDEG